MEITEGGGEEQPKDDTQEVDVDNQDTDNDDQVIDATIEIIPPPSENE